MVPVLGNIVTLLAVDFGDANSPSGAKTWSSVASTSNEQTVTVPGLRLGTDKAFYVSKPTSQAGLGIAGVRISADDTLAITWIASGGTVTPTAGEKLTVLIGRLENPVTNAVA